MSLSGADNHIYKKRVKAMELLRDDILEITSQTTSELDALAGKHVLITGAGGFLGRYFIEVFSEFNRKSSNPIQVTAIENGITGQLASNIQNLKEINVDFQVGDVSLAEQINKKIDFIIHLAGIASPQHYRAKPLETIDVAVNSTRLLLERAKSDNAKILVFSSSEIYGDPTPENVPTSESYRGNVASRGPRACYDESKRLGETLCWVYQNYFQVNASVVRPFNVYGPGMMPSDYRVLPNFAWSIKAGKPLTIYGQGTQTRTFCYITDAITGFIKVLVNEKIGDVYNVGNPTPEVSINQLAEEIARIINKPSNVKHMPYPESYPADEPMRRCPDISKITAAFDYQPKVDLSEGLRRFLNWAEQEYPKISHG
jgi:UDP-glucuronate decarboxylase